MGILPEQGERVLSPTLVYTSDTLGPLGPLACCADGTPQTESIQIRRRMSKNPVWYVAGRQPSGIVIGRWRQLETGLTRVKRPLWEGRFTFESVCKPDSVRG